MKDYDEMKNINSKKGVGNCKKSDKDKLIQDAFMHHSQGNIEKAIECYQLFIDSGHTDPKVFSNYGSICKQLGQTKFAITLYQKSIDLYPDSPEAYANLGLILKDQGNLKAALINTRKAIEINPNSAVFYYNLANIFRDLGNLKEAKSNILKTIELNPIFAEGYLNLSTICKDLGDLNKAEIYSRKAIELNPAFGGAYSNLGSVLSELGKFDQAEKYVHKAIELNPNSAIYHYNLANIFLSQGMAQKAEICNKRALEINPNFADAAWNLSGCVKTIQESEKWLKKCLEIDSNHIAAKVTLSILRAHQSDNLLFNELANSDLQHHPFIRSFLWVLSLNHRPRLDFNKWEFFDNLIKVSDKNRPFYEFGVWRGISFRYLLKAFNKGYGFDTFDGLPEDWHNQKKGSYSSEGNQPEINGGTFIEGKFQDTLPKFFSKARPTASIINFDADLYSSTICAINHAKSIIDEDTILIFDEFIMNDYWEEDEYKALNEFCLMNDFIYKVIAVCYFSKQVAVKLIKKGPKPEENNIELIL